MTNMVAINNQHHANLKITDDTLTQGANLHLVPVVVSEVNKLIVHYSIVLTKFDDTGKFGLSALLGFEEGENLFWQQGEWDAVYIPAQIDRLPFFIGSEPQNKDVNPILCVDMDNAAVNESDGHALFDKVGEPTAFLAEKQQLLAQLLDGEAQNQSFIACLQSLDLITPFTLDITFENGSKTSITGLYTIDEEKLQALSAESIASLHAKGWLQAIYIVVASNAQIYALIDKKNKALKQGDAWFEN
ncbi:SapC family protein [Alteromonas sp. CI.11.F.A3]|uniref:SapC family protein n=1 Tax=Alteromonas sp. CI.11.F.A3 TaxID=3079555 RepID=UPI002941BEAE|nr:SapC family protein [Alteromonas sp. CI.11.F.A3]WOI37762.1 SapC family protein [Alteromonas sp. CI.11.F.A3]